MIIKLKLNLHSKIAETGVLFLILLYGPKDGIALNNSANCTLSQAPSSIIFIQNEANSLSYWHLSTHNKIPVLNTTLAPGLRSAKSVSTLCFSLTESTYLSKIYWKSTSSARKSPNSDSFSRSSMIISLQ